MKLVVQPALEGSVTVEGEVVGKIGKGAVCLVGIHRDDKEEDLDWGVQKLLSFCLFDGDDIAGEAFLWLGHPGWALLDYLCVASDRRNGGLGSVILEKLRETEGDTVIFGESEIPRYAPDPAMAERRLGFYARSGARTAGYDTEMFGVPYKTLYWAAGDVDEAALMEEHRFVYASTFAPDKFARYVRIPFDPQAGLGAKVEWQQ